MQNTHKFIVGAVALGVFAIWLTRGESDLTNDDSKGAAPGGSRVASLPELPELPRAKEVEESPAPNVATSSQEQPVGSVEPGPHRGRFYAISEAEKLGIRDAFRPADHEWEIEVDSILSSGQPDEKIVGQLLLALPRLSGTGQAAAASHLTNLLEDEDYEPLAEVALEQEVGEEALEVIMLDMFNREEEIRLPFFVDLLEKPDHPFHDDAREVLLSVIGHDAPDHDRNGWDEAITEWLERTSPDPLEK